MAVDTKTFAMFRFYKQRTLNFNVCQNNKNKLAFLKKKYKNENKVIFIICLDIYEPSNILDVCLHYSMNLGILNNYCLGLREN